MTTISSLKKVSGSNVKASIQAALEKNKGILRLAPCWVPRPLVKPGGRLKLNPKDFYACGLERGGIDERWLGSTIVTTNAVRDEDEGLSYIIHENERFTLLDAIEQAGAEIIGQKMWDKYKKWPIFSKFFDNAGAIPFHMHQNFEQAALVKQEAKPEAYYFPPQMNFSENNFPYTFIGLIEGTKPEHLAECIKKWDKEDNTILDYSVAYKLKIGTGWLIPPAVLHAPGSLCTYEPQWGSDVACIMQNVVENQPVPRYLLIKDVPQNKHQDVDYLVNQVDWDLNLDPSFKEKFFLEPVIDKSCSKTGEYEDKWIVYGEINGQQLFTAKELTVYPGQKCFLKDNGANSIVVVQGYGKLNQFEIESPSMIDFDTMTSDEFFITDAAAKAGVTYENTSKDESLVILRYFGPDANPQAPKKGN